MLAVPRRLRAVVWAGTCRAPAGHVPAPEAVVARAFSHADRAFSHGLSGTHVAAVRRLTNPSLPQRDDPAEQQLRRAELAQKQAAYVYDHQSRVAPLGVAKTVPKGEGFAPILAGSVVLVVLDLLANVLAKGSKIFGDGGAA